MLSPIYYLLKLKTYFHLEHIPEIHQYTDINSLITRITERKLNKPLSARDYMKSEIDLQMQILQTLQSLLPKNHILKHVKGHQDNETQLEQISWKAKLNVYCDFIATRELQVIQHQRTSIPLLPASKIKLDITGTTITHHIALKI